MFEWIYIVDSTMWSVLFNCKRFRWLAHVHQTFWNIHLAIERAYSHPRPILTLGLAYSGPEF